jgi:hypothetical protein
MDMIMSRQPLMSIWCMSARVQGNCTSEPSALALGISEPALVARKPGQCVLVTEVKLFEVKQNLWMDNLYIRHHITSSTDSGTILSGNGKGCNLWLTSVTLQGGSSKPTGSSGVQFIGGIVYAEGVQTGSLSSQHLRLYIFT